MSRNKAEVPAIIKLKSVDFIVSTVIDFTVVDNVKADKFDIKLDDCVVEIKSKSTQAIHLVPLSNIRVMVKV